MSSFSFDICMHPCPVSLWKVKWFSRCHQIKHSGSITGSCERFSILKITSFSKVIICIILKICQSGMRIGQLLGTSVFLLGADRTVNHLFVTYYVFSTSSSSNHFVAPNHRARMWMFVHITISFVNFECFLEISFDHFQIIAK